VRKHFDSVPHSPLSARTAQNPPVASFLDAARRQERANADRGECCAYPKVIEQVALDEEARQGFSSLWTPAVDAILNQWHNHQNIEVAD
jgi:hypothetical protein